MTVQLVSDFSIQAANETLTLLPSKLIWWARQRTLFMADSHLGKATTFRKAGIPVPAGTTRKMLSRLTDEIVSKDAHTLVVLGDLTHSTSRAEQDFEEELSHWRKAVPVTIRLVPGNHDRLPSVFYDKLGIHLADAAYMQTMPFELCHDPAQASGQTYSLCGHLHPATRLAGQKLPCFWLRDSQIVLPAFGEFTGTSAITLSANEQAVAVCEGTLAVITRNN